MSAITGSVILAFEAAILAVIVAGIAGQQDPDRGSWVERNPLLFGGAIGLTVLLVGLLMAIASGQPQRPASSPSSTRR